MSGTAHGAFASLTTLTRRTFALALANALSPRAPVCRTPCRHPTIHPAQIASADKPPILRALLARLRSCPCAVVRRGKRLVAYSDQARNAIAGT